ncbi:MAG: Rrf2 family transcriptional regulator, partial [Prolixibacteraceae bacterium]|nr:Rrf2 family transcriptional regulator [Prolixibacteraceae bacterium]
MISTKGRYALRIMLDLSQHIDDGYIPLSQISEREGISVKYLEAIVAMLNKAGMVESLRGKEGGYRLTKKPAEYTVASIIKLTEHS